MAIEGFSYGTILTIIAEIGLDVKLIKEKFSTAKHFTSWLSLAPNKKISGGKVLSSKANKNKNPLTQAFRKAANSVGNQKNTPLANFFRKIAAKSGRRVAITATARKIATVFYKMVTENMQYDVSIMEQHQTDARKQKIKYIQRTIRKLDVRMEELDFQ